MNGQLVNWEDANVHVMTHALHYGTSVFEGIRCYETKTGPQIFRLHDHNRRLLDSAKLYRIPVPYSISELDEACKQIIAVNDLTSAYIRPIIFRGAGSLAVLPGDDVPVEVVIAAIEWGAYLGEDGLKNGIDVCVSSWNRMTSASNPILSKAAGHYLNSQLIAGDAKRGGYTEAIVVNANGTISEGSAENIFVVRDNKLMTPPVTASILHGITRDSALTLARALKIEVIESDLPREFLYLADEIFLTGTAAEITPVRSVDGIRVGDGKPGPITKQIQEKFFGLFTGETEDEWEWLATVPPAPQT